MNFPLVSEYIEAIKSAPKNLKELNYLQPVLDDSGNPVMSCGNYAVVFKMRDEFTGERCALKCFIKDQEGRNNAYRLITNELQSIESDYITYVNYYENELFVDTKQSNHNEFPVVLMDWVEGKTLDAFIRDNLHDEYILSVLAYRFSLLAEWLIEQPFAHGDLKPDNIIVQSGCRLKLINYDGMYVPAMEGQKARETGSPDFQHPERTESFFNDQIDDFSLISILVSLKAISIQSDFFLKYGSSDRLLLSKNDYLDIRNSDFLCSIYPHKDKELNKLVSLLFFTLSQKSLIGIRPNELVLKCPPHNLNSTLSEYERTTAEEDEWGNLYTNDGFKLIKAVAENIHSGVKVICDNAYRNSPYTDWYNEIIIPEGVEVIGEKAFNVVGNNTPCYKIRIPKSVNTIGLSALTGCSQIHINSPHFKEIDGNIYSSTEERLLRGYNEGISQKVRTIDEGAFGYSDIRRIIIPYGVKVIDSFTFMHCTQLESITIPNSVTAIMCYAFDRCINLHTLVIPDSVRIIESWAFQDCIEIKNIIIPNNPIHSLRSSSLYKNNDISDDAAVTDIIDGIIIDKEAFEGCHNFTITNNEGEIIIDKESLEQCMFFTVSLKDGRKVINY